jgi:predicted ribosomally synthesized peptide with nif11-like leader
MSENQLKYFLESVKGDVTLQERLKLAVGTDAVVAIAKDAGFVVSVGELRELNEARDLSDEELAEVAGGGFLDVVRMFMLSGSE